MKSLGRRSFQRAGTKHGVGIYGRVPNYTADLPPEAWIESYEMAMELLEVSDAAMAKYFTMMLDGTARSWLKGLPPNSISSWGELKARFIQNFKDTCKQSMSIVDLTDCKQEEGESTTHWVRRVKEIIHSSDKMDAGSAVLMLEKNCRFEPLRMKLGRLKRDLTDMGTLIAALSPRVMLLTLSITVPFSLPCLLIVRRGILGTIRIGIFN